MALVLLCTNVLAQKYLANGDFEDFSKCPAGYVVEASSSVLIGWYSPDDGTPDYFNRCGSGDALVPQTWAGRQLPKDGDGFAGIYVWPNYREYLKTNFIQHLLPDTLYQIKVNYALAGHSPLAGDWLGIRFYDEQDSIISTLMDYTVIDTEPAQGWVTALFEYKSMGAEHGFAIGNFHLDSEIEIIAVPRTYVHPMLEKRSYYFIDAVSISGPAEELIFEKIEVGEPVVLDEIYFEFDQRRLKPSSYRQLDALVLYLMKYDTGKCRITGHTDNVGDKAYNLRLSVGRANAVRDYLIEKGVVATRLETIGKGAAEPVASNKTVEGRKVNRRVIFTLLTN